MASHQNSPNRTLLRTGLLVLVLIFLLPSPSWANCEGVIFRKFLEKKYSGIGAVVIAKAGPVVATRSAMMIMDGWKDSYHYDGETRTYRFSVLKIVMGEAPKMIKVEETYWDSINGGKVDPEKHGAKTFFEGKNYLLFLRPRRTSEFEVTRCGPPENTDEAKWKLFFLDVYLQKLNDDEAIQKLWEELSHFAPGVSSEAEKLGSIKESRKEALEELLQITERKLGRIPRYPLKIMAEILGLLAERNKGSAEHLFEHFNAVKDRLGTYPENEIQLHRNWVLLLASDLAWFRKESFNKVLIPYLAKELKGPSSVTAEFILSNIGTIDAIDEIRKHYTGN